MTDAGAGWRNEAIPVEALPAVDGAPFEQLEPVYLTQQRVLWLVVLAAVALGAIVPLVIVGAPRWVPAVVAIAAVGIAIAAWVLEGLAFAYRGVQLREFDVSTRRGLVSRTTVSVPFSRVQHVTVERGLLDRIFGLAQVVIFTAGAGAADARVKGLDPDRAERLREQLVNRSSEITGADSRANTVSGLTDAGLDIDHASGPDDGN